MPGDFIPAGPYVSASATGLVADAINDGTTTVAPSQNAVFDALASKIANPGGSNDDFLQRKAGVYTNRTIAQVKADLGVPVTAISTSDVSKTSNVTPAAHAQLKVACAANGLYLIRANIQYGGASTGMVALGFSGPTGAATVGGMSALGIPNGASNSPSPASIGTGTTTFGLGQTAIFGGPGNSGGVDRRIHAIIEAVVQMSSTAGDISVIWAQGTSNVTASTVFAGSTLTVTKIG